MRIKISTPKAIYYLVENRKKHQEEFLKQLEGWKDAMFIYSKEMTEWANNGGKSKERPQEPVKPTDYTKDYDRYLELLNLHEEELIELGETEYDNIIKDEFGWKGFFLSNSSTYIK